MKNTLIDCVLYIDDDDINSSITSMIFADLEIAEKLVVLSDGFEALDFLKICTPAFIFVDMRMPAMNGVEFIQKVLQLPQNNKIKIIGMSNLFSKEDRERLKELSITHLIEKPLTEEKIMMCLSTPKEVV